MSDGSLKGVGYNSDGRISTTLQEKVIKDFTDFCIKDSSDRQLAAVSAVCNAYGTLYIFSKSSNERQLVLCDKEINEGDQVFFDIGGGQILFQVLELVATQVFFNIGNHHLVSLLCGRSHSAVIGSKGEVIFINGDSV